MKTKYILVSLGIVLVLVVCMVAVLPRESRQAETHPQNPKFVIASSFPRDAYGQGISKINIYENSSGSWIENGSISDTGDTILNWVAGVGIKLRVYSEINITLTGATTSAQGQLIQRHSVTVSNGSAPIFSQQNFTFYQYLGSPVDPPDIEEYWYDVVLNFIPTADFVYIITVTFEVYYYSGWES